MDRGIIYPGQVPLETDLLFAQKATMIGLGKLAAAMLGTGTLVNGLTVSPNSPAALNVLVSAGEIYELLNIDAAAYSSIAADTSHQIVKQGVSLDTQTIACAAPGTPGFSINYLIQATLTEADGTPVTLPYYNASNPSTAYSGPNNSGSAQNTRRACGITISAKAGTAATTGTQTTPSADAGYVGIAVVTVANGQTQITSGNITALSSSLIPAGGLLVGGIQNAAAIVSAAGGTADALTGSYAPAITQLLNGMTLYVRAASANATTTPTFTPNSGVIAAKTIVKGAGTALSTGDIAGGGHWIELQYDLSLDKWVLLNPATGVNPAVQPGFRNRLINGAMAIDQRNAGAAQTFTAAAALAYCVDRWYGYCTGANVTGQRVAGSGANQYRYQFAGAASVTGIGFGQRIEKANSIDLAGSTATLSVDLANSLLTTVNWTAYYANTDDTFGTLASPTRTQIATGSFTVNGTVTRYSTPISIPAAATTGIEIVFSVGAQTSGTWAVGNVQLEPGATATTFERRPIGYELNQCQRYYQNNANGVHGYSPGTSTYYGFVSFPVQMRAAPTIGLSNFNNANSGNASAGTAGVTGFDVSAVGSATGIAYSKFSYSASVEL